MAANEVTAVRAQRSGWAGREVQAGESYPVPDYAVAGLVRQGLVADPFAELPEPEPGESEGDVDQAEV